MSDDPDYLYALELQKQFNDELSDNDVKEVPEPMKKPTQTVGKYRSNKDEDYLSRMSNLVHPQWEVLDPTPDTAALFKAFDDKFFQKKLRCVTFEWSKRMYSCAGICYQRKNSMGMSIIIRLSEPLLKLRSRKDLIETLLHEMIHAYCFVLGIREGNGGHGPNFKKIMTGINKVAGTNITVYHSFHDEVNLYKIHWWRCNGVCQHRSPFYGYVKRSSNRAPGPGDFWWSQHHNTCGGTFMKIKGPNKPEKDIKPKKPDLRKFFRPTGGSIKSNGSGTVLLNPKHGSTIQSKQPSPPPATETKYNPTRNLTNVVGFKDLVDNRTSQSVVKSPRFSDTTKGYSLVDTSNKHMTVKEVDPGHLRDCRLKRFDKKVENLEKRPPESGDSNKSRDDKSPPISHETADGSEKSNKSKDISWVELDDDIMVNEGKESVIVLSSSDEEDVVEQIDRRSPPAKVMTFTNSDERQKQIKKEILDESIDLINGDGDDIVLIDDDYNDDFINTTSEIADTSIIDDLFGEDTLLKEFKRENAIGPSCSRYSSDPRNDIITCPICQEKMKRENLSDHLDGCVGISEVIALPKYSKAKAKKTISSSPKKRSNTRTTAGIRKYFGADESQGASDDNQAIRRPVNVTQTSEELSVDDLELTTDSTDTEETDASDRLRRMRDIYSDTRPCPVCCSEVEVDRINEHLDECLSN